MNMRVMKGIPVRMRDLMDGDVSTLTSRSSVDLDAGMFRVPDGYQKRDMLHLADGSLLPFAESYRLCGQCHAQQLKQWKAGDHGRALLPEHDVAGPCPTGS